MLGEEMKLWIVYYWDVWEDREDSVLVAAETEEDAILVCRRDYESRYEGSELEEPLDAYVVTSVEDKNGNKWEPELRRFEKKGGSMLNLGMVLVILTTACIFGDILWRKL